MGDLNDHDLHTTSISKTLYDKITITNNLTSVNIAHMLEILSSYNQGTKSFLFARFQGFLKARFKVCSLHKRKADSWNKFGKLGSENVPFYSLNS